MVKTAPTCKFAIAQKLTSNLLYLFGFHFKTLRHVVTSKPCQNVNLKPLSHGARFAALSAALFSA